MDSKSKDFTALQERFDRVQSTNRDLIQDLSATSKRLQKLAISLGYDDAYEAQADIDASTSDLTYRSCLETIRVQQAEMESLRKELELAQKQNMALKKRTQRLVSSIRLFRSSELIIDVFDVPSLKEFPLDADTTGYLLSFLPDLPSLFSILLSCKFLYGVFRADCQSVTSAVVSNQIGPALPQALRLARTEVARLRQAKISELPIENSVLSLKISRQEAAVLASNAEVVVELENLFSWKCKDRKSTTSVLTEQESARFQRALYRIMLLCFTYGRGSMPEQQTTEDEYEQPAYHSKPKAFLEGFPMAELYEIQRVAFFLRYLASIRLSEDSKWAGMQNTYGCDSMLLYLGPRLILRCYKYCDSFDVYYNIIFSECFDDDDGPSSKFIIEPLEQVLSRDTNTQPEWSEIILDSIHGKDDICGRCQFAGVFTGEDLVNNTCWSDLKGDLSKTIGLYFRKLWSNPTEIKARESLRDIDYRNLMDILFSARRGKHSDWREDEWTCRECLRSLWTDSLLAWWLEQKGAAGVPIKRDCWHGYMCGKQSKKEHAEAFNHLCEPTRFDYHR